MPGNSLILDTSVVVKHFRNATAVTGKLAGYEDLFLPQQALGELYYGAYRSARPEKHLAQIERFLLAVDVLTADKETSVLYQRAIGVCQSFLTDSMVTALEAGLAAAAFTHLFRSCVRYWTASLMWFGLR